MASTQSVSPLSRPKAAGDESDPSFATTLAHGLDVLAAFRNSSGSLSNAGPAASTGPPAADGVAADIHAGAAWLPQARREGTPRTRPWHTRCGLPRSVSSESPANGEAPDARLRGLCGRHRLHSDAVRARLH